MTRFHKYLFVLTLVFATPVSHAAEWADVMFESEADDLVALGKLERIMLTPEEFGGTESPYNMVYVPAGISNKKQQITDKLSDLALRGDIDRVTYEPIRDMRSVVPKNIVIRAWSTKSRAGFVYQRTIKIW